MKSVMKNPLLHLPAKRLTSLCLAAMQIFIIFSMSIPSYAIEQPQVENAESALVYNFENDTVLFEYNQNERVYPTSTVKLMTALVAYDVLKDRLSETITITSAMLNDVIGNNIGLEVGEVVTVEQMFNVLLINSANDAAIVLAYAAYGGTDDFVVAMNDKAQKIGAYDTYYTNCTGLHNDAMVTTAHDTAIIARKVYEIPLFIEIASTPKYTMDATNMSDYRNIYNRNCLISKYYNTSYFYDKAVGLNAGSTTQGGYCIAAVAEDAAQSLTYLVVVMDAEDNDEGYIFSYENAINLFDWAFESYCYKEVLSDSRFVTEVGVELSTTLDYVTLAPEKSIEVYLPSDVDVDTDIRYSYNTYEDSLEAPVKKGDVAGTITVMYGDEILGSCSLVTTSDISRSEFLYFLSRVRAFATSRFFRATVIAFIVLSIAYVLLNAAYKERKHRPINTNRSKGRRY